MKNACDVVARCVYKPANVYVCVRACVLGGKQICGAVVGGTTSFSLGETATTVSSICLLLYWVGIDDHRCSVRSLEVVCAGQGVFAFVLFSPRVLIFDTVVLDGFDLACSAIMHGALSRLIYIYYIYIYYIYYPIQNNSIVYVHAPAKGACMYDQATKQLFAP